MKYHLCSGFFGRGKSRHMAMPPPAPTCPCPPGTTGHCGWQPLLLGSSFLRGFTQRRSIHSGPWPCSPFLRQNQISSLLVRPVLTSMVSLGVFPPFLCGRTGRRSLRSHSPAAVLHWGDWRPRGGGPEEKYWDQVGARRVLRCHPFPHRHLSTTHLLSSHHQIEESPPL